MEYFKEIRVDGHLLLGQGNSNGKPVVVNCVPPTGNGVWLLNLGEDLQLTAGELKEGYWTTVTPDEFNRFYLPGTGSEKKTYWVLCPGRLVGRVQDIYLPKKISVESMKLLLAIFQMEAKSSAGEIKLRLYFDLLIRELLSVQPVRARKKINFNDARIVSSALNDKSHIGPANQISPYRRDKVCKTFYGKSFCQLQREMALHESLKKLSCSGAPLAQIASETGYLSTEMYITAFRRIYHISPHRLRRQMAAERR